MNARKWSVRESCKARALALARARARARGGNWVVAIRFRVVGAMRHLSVAVCVWCLVRACVRACVFLALARGHCWWWLVDLMADINGS